MRPGTHRTLCSVVFSVMSVAAFAPSTGNSELATIGGAASVQKALDAIRSDLNAQGVHFPGGIPNLAPLGSIRTPASTPAQQAVPGSSSVAGSPLTQTQLLDELRKYVTDKGKKKTLKKTAGALGFQEAALPVSEYGELDSKQVWFYSVATIQIAGQADLIFGKATSDAKVANGSKREAYVYRVKSDFKTVTNGAAVLPDAGGSQILPIKEDKTVADAAEKDVAEQTAFWLDFANKKFNTPIAAAAPTK